MTNSFAPWLTGARRVGKRAQAGTPFAILAGLGGFWLALRVMRRLGVRV